MRILLPLLLMLALGSCATLNRAECEAGDWRLIGFEDGAQGRVPEYIAQHREACAEFGISPDLASYLNGREQGLLQYCVPQNAYDLGRRGRSINNVCPAYQAQELNTANFRGREYNRITGEIRALEQDISDYEETLSTLDGKVDGTPVLRRSLNSSIGAANFEILQLRARRSQFESWR